MDVVSIVVVMVGAVVSFGGMTVLCLALDRRNRQEVRRERLGLPIGGHSWP